MLSTIDNREPNNIMIKIGAVRHVNYVDSPAKLNPIISKSLVDVRIHGLFKE